MKKVVFILLTIFMASVSHAASDYGLELGIRQQAGDVSGPNISTNSQLGGQFGGYLNIPLPGSGIAHWRTGLFYTDRPLQTENDITSVQINYDLQYLDIPLDILFKPSEEIGMYFGFNVSINVGKSCSGDSSCKVSGVNTPLFPMVFGFLYKFTPKWGLDFYIDGVNSYVAKGLYDYRAVGLNVTFSLN